MPGMIQGSVMLGERPALLTGLGPTNRKKLLAGLPIRLDGAPFGVRGAHGFLCAASTHEELTGEFRKHGVTFEGPLPELRPEAPLRIEAIGKKGNLIMIIGLTAAGLTAIAAGEHMICTGDDIGQRNNRFIIAGTIGEAPDPDELAAILAPYPMQHTRRHLHRPTELERHGMRLNDVLDRSRNVLGYAVVSRSGDVLGYRLARAGTGFCDCP
jgi:hypothetical protein